MAAADLFAALAVLVVTVAARLLLPRLGRYWLRAVRRRHTPTMRVRPRIAVAPDRNQRGPVRRW